MVYNILTNRFWNHEKPCTDLERGVTLQCQKRLLISNTLHNYEKDYSFYNDVFRGCCLYSAKHKWTCHR